jgi:hypothetical protein
MTWCAQGTAHRNESGKSAPVFGSFEEADNFATGCCEIAGWSAELRNELPEPPHLCLQFLIAFQDPLIPKVNEQLLAASSRLEQTK